MRQADVTAIRLDLYSPAFRASTYETFARMRDENPVFCQPGLDGETPIWFVTRYDDVLAVLRDDERFVRDPALALDPALLAEQRAALPPEFAFVENHMLNKDGADHRRLRRLVTKAFTPRMVERLRPRIEAIAGELLDAVEARGEMELVEEFAFPLPIIVIAELLGIPPRDRGRFRAWSDAVVTPALTPEARQRAELLMREFVAYLGELFERRRAEPRDDLVSALLQAEDGGDTLSEEELFSMVVLLIVAGHETTVSLLGNAVLALLEDPGARGRALRDRASTRRAVEELLRFDGPVERALTRWAAADVELGRQTIRRGEVVIAILGSANRDERRFPDADRLDVERDDPRHLAFGQGSHYCLGAPLARLEAEVALTALFSRLPGLRLAVARQELAWRPTPLFRGLAALPLRWDD